MKIAIIGSITIYYFTVTVVTVHQLLEKHQAIYFYANLVAG